MEMELPSAPGTDGAVLVDQAKHSLIRDMITRVDTWFPRYGITPGYGAPTNNGFQEILTASLSGALELGAHEYARGVLENYLRYYLKQRGTIAYRGLEMAESGRMLTLFAQYWRFTGDSQTLLRYFGKIQGIVALLSGRRQQALDSHPAGSPLRGMPIGHDEADLFVTWAAENPTGNHSTELPFFSIGSEFWRGLIDLGAAWTEIGALTKNQTVLAAGDAMTAAAPPLLLDLQAAMVATHKQSNGSCWPYVAGRTDCAELAEQASDRDSEPWRTYAEMCWSGLPATSASDTTTDREFLTDMIQWSRNHGKSMKLGMLSGTGSDASGNNLMTFTGIGWGYGLLMADDIETFLLQLWTVATHANTRGTWTAPEEADIGGGAMPYATSSQMVMPIHLKWMLVWEHPITQTLWIGRALPRAWLAEGLPTRRSTSLADGSGSSNGSSNNGSLVLRNVASSWGRFSLSLTSKLGSSGCIAANITWVNPASARAARGVPAGGLVLRLRTPGKRQIASVALVGRALLASAWNTTDESVSFTAQHLGKVGLAEGLQRIFVCYAK
jgi:hypothetical protein